MQWLDYILACADGSFYVGHTQNMALRVQCHNEGRGARHTTARRPVRLAYSERYDSKSAGVNREGQIKRRTPTD